MSSFARVGHLPEGCQRYQLACFAMLQIAAGRSLPVHKAVMQSCARPWQAVHIRKVSPRPAALLSCLSEADLAASGQAQRAAASNMPALPVRPNLGQSAGREIQSRQMNALALHTYALAQH